MLGFRVLQQDFIPVGNNGHFLVVAVFVYYGGIVKGDAISPIAFYQRNIDVVSILITEVFLLQRVPDGQPGDLFCQNRVAAGCQVFQAGIGVKGFAADGHDVGAVLGRGRQTQV